MIPGSAPKIRPMARSTCLALRGDRSVTGLAGSPRWVGRRIDPSWVYPGQPTGPGRAAYQVTVCPAISANCRSASSIPLSGCCQSGGRWNATRRPVPAAAPVRYRNWSPVPRIPFTLDGAVLVEVYPIAPLAPGQVLVIGLSWYQNRAYVALSTDRDMLPDVQHLADAIEPAACALGGLLE